VQFGVNFDKFSPTGFAKNRLMFLKVWINFSIYSERGANFKKLEMVRCFILDFLFFLKFVCITKKKCKRKKKIIIIKKIS